MELLANGGVERVQCVWLTSAERKLYTNLHVLEDLQLPLLGI